MRDVLWVAELQRVDEDGHHDGVALGTRPRHEREVSVVQSAHGRHEADAGAACARRIELRVAGGGGLDDLHDVAPQTVAGTAGTVWPRGTVSSGVAVCAPSLVARRVARAAPAW